MIDVVFFFKHALTILNNLKVNGCKRDIYISNADVCILKTDTNVSLY